MASDKRQFTDFRKFPGKLESGVHVFPELRYPDGSGKKMRTWKISVRLIKQPATYISEINWNMLAENQIPIHDKYYGHLDDYADIPAGTVAQIWTEAGEVGGQITRSAPTYITQPTNVGKINQRSIFHTALIEARSRWIPYHDKNTKKKTKTSCNTPHYPMLARPWKDGVKHLKYPLFVQPKLDGVRCLMFIPKKDCGHENLVVYSREKKMYNGYSYFKRILYPLLNDLYDEDKNQSIFLDGELYKHGKSLQKISGDARNSKSPSSDGNEYHIYDCFYPLELDTQFSDRYEQLKELFNGVSDKAVRQVPTHLVTEKQADQWYNKWIKAGYEGAMYRNADAPYLASVNSTGSKLRSYNLIKRKKQFTDEYEVVSYTQGKKGKDLGAILWIAQTAEGKRFNVTPKGITYAERYKLFSDAEKNFNNKYLGRMLTVQYDDLSNAGIPLRAKALAFRDYE